MQDLNDLYHFVSVVDHGGSTLPAGRWACVTAPDQCCINVKSSCQSGAVHT
jgi:hypothetical protein